MLGGGGVTGIAWELGMLAGLAAGGLDLSSADLVVGTSAGAVVGAQLLSGTPIEDLYQDQLLDIPGELAARLGPAFALRFIALRIWPPDQRRALRRLGRAALRTRTVPESDRRAVIEQRLRRHEWPGRRLLLTAIEVESGELVVFDRESGVPIVDAVAASCAVPVVWPPVSIGGRRYVDGGCRSLTNADLAIGCELVVVLAPSTVAFGLSGRIQAQLKTLGPAVRSLVVSPDRPARRTIGPNSLDPSRRAAAAAAGRRQSGQALELLAEAWARRSSD